MDKALIRPGRFGKQLYVPLPTPLERGLILRAVARKKPVDSSVDFNAVARMEACEHFSGADLAALVSPTGLTFALYFFFLLAISEVASVMV